MSQNETKALEIKESSDKRRKMLRSTTVSGCWGDHSIYAKGTLKTWERVYNSSVTDRQAQDNLKEKIKELVKKT